jgi:Ala-tRNA(Pro) deacylase
VHVRTESAEEEAAASGVPASRAMKTLVLRDGAHRLLLVAVPASERLDFDKVRALLGDSRLELASEQDMARSLPRFDVGAIPPLGDGLPRLAVLDERVCASERVVCSGGDHEHALSIAPADLVRVASPQVADICRT